MKYARLLPQHYHSYPPDYRCQWFPVLEQHPVTKVVAHGVQAVWANHLEFEERDG
jgi:hypothetical protein